MRRFNVTGLCIPTKHYMVDISEKLNKIGSFIDDGSYFTINRARQYGKTTTLYLLEERLKDEYTVASISFEGIGNDPFKTEESFCKTFSEIFADSLTFSQLDNQTISKWTDHPPIDMKALSKMITALCKENKVLLFIDEVDKTSNNQVFLGFIGMLRDKYLLKERGKDFTFHSVILAGVNDIKTIKLKLLNRGSLTLNEGEGSYNSPWNIAIKFTVDMSFSVREIETMLLQYEDEHHLGMNTSVLANEIYDYTSGYPFLVSRICQAIDEELGKNWTSVGVKDAVKVILNETSTLFSDIIKNLEDNHELYNLVYDIIIVGTAYESNPDNPLIALGSAYGIFDNSESFKLQITNKIFIIRLANYFISKNATSSQITKKFGVLQYDVVQSDRFDMALCLTKFGQHYNEIYSQSNAKFLEEHGRILFLTYLKPLINGKGFYHIESQLTDLRRMDLVVDYADEQFILELKLWRGEHAHEKAYVQLADYLITKNQNVGYLLTFDFRTEGNKQTKAEWVLFHEKRIFDVIV